MLRIILTRSKLIAFLNFPKNLTLFRSILNAKNLERNPGQIFRQNISQSAYKKKKSYRRPPQHPPCSHSHLRRRSDSPYCPCRPRPRCRRRTWTNWSCRCWPRGCCSFSFSSSLATPCAGVGCFCNCRRRRLPWPGIWVGKRPRWRFEAEEQSMECKNWKFRYYRNLSKKKVVYAWVFWLQVAVWGN